MAPFRLSDREQGSQFCRFERNLIFDPSLKDVGFVHYLSKRTFTLLKSRFTDIDNKRIYLLPGDIEPPDEGTFVRLEVGRIEKLVIKQGKGSPNFNYREGGQVESIESPHIPLPPPSIPRNEFIHRISSNWKDPEEDMLDIIMSMLMVSAPGSVYGQGGLGSDGLETARSAGTGTTRDVSNTLVAQLPTEFRMKSRSRYRYSILDSVKARKEFLKSRSSENTFSILHSSNIRYSERSRKDDIPIQLPYVLENAELRSKREGLDLDILEYQLTALYKPPPEEGSVVKMGEDLMRIAQKESVWPGFGDIMLDKYAVIKIHMALTRLNVGKTFDGKMFRRQPLETEEGNRIFQKIMKRGFEEIERSIMKEKVMDTTVQLPWREKLKPIDREIYYYLRKTAEDTGNRDIPLDSIDMKITEMELEKVLQRLNRYGYILFMRGGTVIRVIVSSSPEDSS